MRHRARRKEGPRAPLFFTAILSAAATAEAQSIDRALLEQCASLATPVEKLACFEGLLEEPVPVETAQPESMAESDPVAATTVAGETDSVPAPAAEEAAVAAPAPVAVADPEPAPQATPREDIRPVEDSATATAQADNATPTAEAEDATPAAEALDDAPTAETFNATATDTAGVTSTLPVAATASTANAASVDPPDDLGREHIERAEPDPEPEPEVVRATVTEVRRDAYRRLHFHFGNGQVWRQMERRNFSYPRGEPFDVEISQGMLGDYQLRVRGQGRMTRIVRVQ